MSVLSFPRIYFKGHAEWAPCTFNNNDWQAFQTYAAAHAALNWPFLATGNPPITPGNFGQTFRPWAVALQNDIPISRQARESPPSGICSGATRLRSSSMRTRRPP
jgi:hypothetical protein